MKPQATPNFFNIENLEWPGCMHAILHDTNLNSSGMLTGSEDTDSSFSTGTGTGSRRSPSAPPPCCSTPFTIISAVVVTGPVGTPPKACPFHAIKLAAPISLLKSIGLTKVGKEEAVSGPGPGPGPSSSMLLVALFEAPSTGVLIAPTVGEKAGT